MELYATTQRELQMSIQSNNAFKEEGKFSVGKYKALLKMNGLVDVEYERMIDIIFCIKFNITKLALLVVQRLHTLEC
jgi:hypothetical protein